MSFALLAFASYLVLIGTVRAQVSAPDCTDPALAWVSSHCANARFALQQTIISHVLYIVIQFAPTKSLLDHSILVGGLRRWQFVHAPLKHRVQSHWRIAAFTIPALLPQNVYAGPSGDDDSDLCKCNTVVYNLISACSACQGGQWISCVDQSLFFLDSNQSTNFFTQLLYVVVQLYHHSKTRNVSPVSFLPVYILDLLPQLSRADPS